MNVISLIVHYLDINSKNSFTIEEIESFLEYMGIKIPTQKLFKEISNHYPIFIMDDLDEKVYLSQKNEKLDLLTDYFLPEMIIEKIRLYPQK